MSGAPIRDPFRNAKEIFVREFFDNMLSEEKGCVARVAERAQVHPSVVYRYMERFGMKTEDFNPDLKNGMRARAVARAAEQKRAAARAEQERSRGR